MFIITLGVIKKKKKKTSGSNLTYPNRRHLAHYNSYLKKSLLKSSLGVQAKGLFGPDAENTFKLGQMWQN